MSIEHDVGSDATAQFTVTRLFQSLLFCIRRRHSLLAHSHPIRFGCVQFKLRVQTTDDDDEEGEQVEIYAVATE